MKIKAVISDISDRNAILLALRNNKRDYSLHVLTKQETVQSDDLSPDRRNYSRTLSE